MAICKDCIYCHFYEDVPNCSRCTTATTKDNITGVVKFIYCTSKNTDGNCKDFAQETD